jgi:hypothetical protein
MNEVKAPTLYVATVNTPGYLPWADEPAVFESAQDAWSYLAEERQRGEDSAAMVNDAYADQPYSDTFETLAALGHAARTASDVTEYNAVVYGTESAPDTTANGEGTVNGDTPGYDGDHDLGLAYSVAQATPNDDGYAELLEASTPH